MWPVVSPRTRPFYYTGREGVIADVLLGEVVYRSRLGSGLDVWAVPRLGSRQKAAVFEEGGEAWLLYAVQGEGGSAIARLEVPEG